MTTPPADREKRLAQWRSWLEAVREELSRAYVHQEIWTEVRDAMRRQQPNEDYTFFASYSKLYVDSQCMTIRRVARREDRSLGRLITAMLNDPEVLTRERYVADAADEGDAGFMWGWASPDDSEHIDPRRLQRDLDRLTGVSRKADEAADEAAMALKRVLAHADKRVAHMDASGTSFTFAQLREALATMASICHSYGELLTYSDQSFEPVTFLGDWHGPLRASLWPDELAGMDESERRYERFLRGNDAGE